MSIDATVYAGEAVTIPVDLDTSDSEAGYDLAGMVLAFRVAAVNTIETLLEVTPQVTDEDAGTLTVTLSAEDTTTLGLGVFDAQLIDTEQPVMLASGRLTVRALLDAPAVS